MKTHLLYWSIEDEIIIQFLDRKLWSIVIKSTNYYDAKITYCKLYEFQSTLILKILTVDVRDTETSLALSYS